jgi:hypothetical protein
MIENNNPTAPCKDRPSFLCKDAGAKNEPEIYETMKEYRAKIREYLGQLNTRIVTTRFNTDTLLENAAFRQKNTKVGCIYCCPTPVSAKIAPDMVLFVLEMNNSKNRIEGIGMVKNHAICDKYKVYFNLSYNRFVYMGKTRIAREDMTEEEEEIMKVFDVLCFKGATNMKRGQGITSFPIEMLYKCAKNKDLVEFVRQMFLRRMRKDRSEELA